MLSTFDKYYLAFQVFATLTCFLIFFRNISSKARMKKCIVYLNFLFRPWKIITYFIATIGLALLSLFIDDPTWDISISIIMATLTYLLSSYSVGSVYRAYKYKYHPIKYLFPIFSLLIASSWSYDLYNFFSIGHLPISWAENLILSSIVFVVSGIFWNIESKNNEISFSFFNDNWPSQKNNITPNIAIKLILPIMLLIAIFFCSFYFFK